MSGISADTADGEALATNLCCCNHFADGRTLGSCTPLAASPFPALPLRTTGCPNSHALSLAPTPQTPCFATPVRWHLSAAPRVSKQAPGDRSCSFHVDVAQEQETSKARRNPAVGQAGRDAAEGKMMDCTPLTATPFLVEKRHTDTNHQPNALTTDLTPSHVRLHRPSRPTQYGQHPRLERTPKPF